MSIASLAKAVAGFAKSNSPVLMTVAATSGVVLTAVVSARAGYKSGYDEGFEHHPGGFPIGTMNERVRKQWKHFVPAAAATTITVGVIVAGHRMNSTQMAAATAAYSLSERAFSEYRTRVVDKLGETEEREIRNQVHEVERVRESHKNIVLVGDGNVLCYESFTDRYFMSDRQAIRAAINDVNQQIFNNMYASLEDFYDYLNIGSTQHAAFIGWNSDTPLTVGFHAALSPDDKPCLVMTYANPPFPEFSRLT